METIAKLKHLRISPRKVRLVANLIKGLDVQEAKFQLENLSKASSEPILKLVNSALANAKHNFNLSDQGFFIKKIFVDQGPTLKRWMPRAMGRAAQIMKRTSHITLVLDQREGVVAKKIKEDKQKSESKMVLEPKADLVASEPEKKPKSVSARRPYQDSARSKKKFFSRQTFGNIKKMFRRKSI